jgi:transcriptional regulator PpsR
VKHFKSPKRSLGDLDAKTAARLISAATDIALVVDKSGKIRDVSCDEAAIEGLDWADWHGRKLVDLVTVESVPKITEMLANVSDEPDGRRYQANHPRADGIDIPISYHALRLKDEDTALVIGRGEQRSAQLQRKLLNAQTQIDRDYARLIQIETRYQALFRFSNEAIMIVDAATKKVIDANQSIVQLFANGSRELVGRSLDDLVAVESQPQLDALLATVRSSPKASDVSLKLVHKDNEYRVAASLFRDQSKLLYLIRVEDPRAVRTDEEEKHRLTRLQTVLDALPDAFVVVDKNRNVLSANATFAELTQLATEDQAIGQPITRWLGRVSVDTDVLFANLHQNGFIVRHGALLKGEFGVTHDVDISGVYVEADEQPCFGLIIRRVPAESELASDTALVPGQPSIAQLKSLVGRTPLREVVRQTTDIIERMCIEAALELTGDNRASAAEMLGVSRQSLYIKLRRHQLGKSENDAH